MSTPPPPGPQPGQPSYGATPPAGGPPAGYPGSGYQAPGYPQQSGGRPKGKPTLGIIAAAAAIVGTLIGTIITAIGGAAMGSSLSGMYDYDAYSGQIPDAALGGILGIFAGFAVYGILALWGLIQGIVATVLNRGRGWGIAAIVISVLGGVPVFLGYVIGIASAVPSYY